MNRTPTSPKCLDTSNLKSMPPYHQSPPRSLLQDGFSWTLWLPKQKQIFSQSARCDNPSGASAQAESDFHISPTCLFNRNSPLIASFPRFSPRPLQLLFRGHLRHLRTDHKTETQGWPPSPHRPSPPLRLVWKESNDVGALRLLRYGWRPWYPWKRFDALIRPHHENQ